MKKPMSKWRIAVLILCAAVATLSCLMLISYFSDLARENRMNDELRELYHDGENPWVTSTPITPEPTATVTPVPTAAPAPTEVIPQMLPRIQYPGQGAFLMPTEKFLKLKQKNTDIIGWLTVDEVVDNAVVQRDNEYYLTRDYLNKKNVNGAIFLDESISLQTRPYTLMMFGHNMKTGAMFGKLLKYKECTWYRKHAYASFETQYEEGEYIIFSAGKIQAVPGPNYVNLYALMTDLPESRESVIRQLQNVSFFHTGIEVRPEDQLLLLVTCDGDKEERFVVAARRLREGENKSELDLQIMQSYQVR